MSARIVVLIEVFDRRGFGVRDDPVRLVRQWWTKAGALVVEERDPFEHTDCECTKCKPENRVPDVGAKPGPPRSWR